MDGSWLWTIVISVSPTPWRSKVTVTTLAYPPVSERQVKLSRCGGSTTRYSPSISVRKSGKVMTIRRWPPMRGSIATWAVPGAGAMNSASAAASTQRA